VMEIIDRRKGGAGGFDHVYLPINRNTVCARTWTRSNTDSAIVFVVTYYRK
jgi:hypothetical protein